MNTYYDPTWDDPRNDDDDPIDTSESYVFRDGSMITLHEFDEPTVTVPRFRSSKRFIAEDVAAHCELNEYDIVESRNYILHHDETIR